VHAATLVHRREPGLIIAVQPYPVIDVELTSGPPGDYVTKRIAAEPVVVVRGKDGVVRVLANRCTHRGNRLQRGEGEHDVVPLPVPRLDVQQRRRPVQRADARRVR
jgi:phenylpropionate dioxygenase-like ring-hydroxylating dioxygenase large terminal subunit